MTQHSGSSALDEYLVIECQLGNADAFRALFRRWHPRLLGHAQTLTEDREAAIDVTQESWIGIVRGLRSLRDPARFPSWALRIVANKARDWIRREQSRRRLMERVAVDAPPTATPDERDDALEHVRTGLAALDRNKRRVLSLHYLEGRSVAEIASELGVPPGTVKSRLFNARNELRQRLEEE